MPHNMVCVTLHELICGQRRITKHPAGIQLLRDDYIKSVKAVSMQSKDKWRFYTDQAY